MTRQIIAAGGDAVFDTILHSYILKQCKSNTPKICLLPTPSGDNQHLIYDFFSIFGIYNCIPDYLPLFHNKEADIENFLLSQDIIIVSGGHTKSAIHIWEGWGIPNILKRAYENGTILTGGSAGAVCWAKECITDSFAGKLSVMKCLNFLPFSICPHYVSKERRQAFKLAIAENRISAGYGISDGAAIHFVDEKAHRSVASVKEASSFFVERASSLKKENSVKSTRFDIVNL